MKPLAIAASLGLVALVGAPASAQYPQVPPAAPYAEDPAYAPAPYPQPNVYAPAPYTDANANAYDDVEDGDEDVYYDTVAAENYDDGYDPNAYQQFESALAPYGDWVDDGTYGRIWVPSVNVVGSDFSPYSTGGHWVLTDYGWTWVSDWDWGWAPFHYGRWVDSSWGWCWVPGTQWGPAWVSWRWGGGYAGWAPLPPRGVVVGPPAARRSPWRFVLGHELGSPRPHFLPRAVLPSVFARTSVVTNVRTAAAGGATVRFNAGPLAGAVHPGLRPVPLHSIAPNALPRPTVMPRPGMPLQARPWVQHPGSPGWAGRPLAPAVGHPTPVAPRPMPGFSRPTVPAPGLSRPLPSRPLNGTVTVVRPTPPVYRGPAPVYRAPTYAGPMYHAPAPMYHAPAPMYHAPAPMYHAPTYAGPVYHAPAAPAYHAPAPTYHAPAAPAYHAPAAPAYHAPAPMHMGFAGGGGRHR
jgi:hypothetical protein